jgi:NitT/TauT family transport system substrate-binding protein
MRLVRRLTTLGIAAALLVSCSSNDEGDTTPSTTDADTSSTVDGDVSNPETIAAISAVADGEPFPEDRCTANREAGTITFLTGFDFAAAASIVEVINADALGYYDELCLDVDIVASFSTANYPLVASGQGQFASGGSFSEVVSFSVANDVDLVAISIAGATPIDSLMLKPGVLPDGTDLSDPVAAAAALAGTTIGVKGKLPPSLETLLLEAGLTRGADYETVPVEGFDPVAHMALEGIVGVPGWKSNEPGRLEREGVEFDLLDPTLADIPGSCGVIFTTREFIETYPTAAEDFVRATLRGLQAAIDNPQAAAEAAVELVLANGNPQFLSPEGEIFRWATEAALISSRTAAGTVPGTPDFDATVAEITAYHGVGLFGDGPVPSIDSYLLPRFAAELTSTSGTLIWPA